MISASLLVKYLVIGGGGIATGTGIHYLRRNYFSNDKILEGLAEMTGFSCIGYPSSTKGVDCVKKRDEIKIKQLNDSTFGIETLVGGKIRAYLESGEEEYTKGYRFVIEEGDITTSFKGKNLEEFETYEIKHDGTHWKLNQKRRSWEEKRRLLGLPEGEEGCNFPEGKRPDPINCTLTPDQLKTINFEDKVVDLVGEGESTITLKISKVSAEEAEQFPLGYKFELQSNRDISLGDDKSIKKNTNTEFKIKREGTGQRTKLSLERAWTVEGLAEKVGLNCQVGESNECTLGESINVNNNEGESETTKKFSGLTKKVSEGEVNNKIVKYELDQEGYNQGIKFFVDGENDIELQTSNGENGGDRKILKKKSESEGTEVTYQILKDADGKWYLTKKTITPTPAPAQVPVAEPAQVPAPAAESPDGASVPGGVPVAATEGASSTET